MSDLYVLQFEGLVTIHRAIDDAFGAVAEAPLDAVVPAARGAAGFLLAHHDAESKILFPGLRRAGRMRSTDASALDARDREHHELHALCERLLAASAVPDVVALVRETRDRLRAHVAEEERTLAADRLREMATTADLDAINRDIEAFRAARAPAPHVS